MNTTRNKTLFLLMAVFVGVYSGPANADGLTWQQLTPMPAESGMPIQIGRAGMCAGVASDRLVFIGGTNFPEPAKTATRGGVKTYYQSAFVRDLAASTWQYVEHALPVYADQFLSVQLEDGFLCVGGMGSVGVDVTASPLSSVYHVTVDDDGVSVSQWPDLPEPSSAPVGGVSAGTLFATAGKHVYAMDIDRHEAGWNKITTLPWRTRSDFAGQIVGGSLYVMGGRWQEENSWEFSAEALRFDLASGEWHVLCDLPKPFSHLTPIAFDDDSLFVVGGAGPRLFNIIVAAIERRDKEAIGSPEWQRGNDEVTALYDHFPGFNAAVFRYDVANNRWSQSGWHPGSPAIKRSPIPYRDGFVLAGGETHPGKRTDATWYVGPES